MSADEIAKAWKNAEYRDQLDEETRSQLPESPIGEIDLSDEELEAVDGAAGQNPDTTWPSVVISIVSAASVAECTSLLSGGTCHVDSAGCC